MNLSIEGDNKKTYRMSVDVGSNTEFYTVVSSNIPDEYKIYERQARVALHEYKDKELPPKITCAWC